MSWLVPSQPDVGREVMPLNNKDGSFLQPVLGERGKKEKKAKGCCFGPPESQGKS